MSVTSIQEKQLSPFVEQYESVQDDLPGQSGELKQFRAQALTQFAQMGFPTLRDEDWRFTPLKPMLSKSFALQLLDDAEMASSVKVEDFAIDNLDTYQLVFVDGVLMHALSSALNIDGVCVTPLSQLAKEQPERAFELLSQFETPVENAFVALNNASVSQGVVIDIAKGANIDKPIEMLFIGGAKNSWSQPRVMLRVAADASVSLLERHVSNGDEKYVSNMVCDVELAPQAKLQWYILQQQSQQNYHISSTVVKQYEGSELHTHTVSLGGALIRNQITVAQLGEHVQSTLNGVYALSQRQHVDNHTRVIHAMPNGRSDELYKGILDQRSHAVFHGRIKVAQDAQKIDSQQANHTLLLSRDAQIDTKPQLEIYADDVKCAHGATVGELDKTALFYLQTRGIKQAQARALLTYGFINEVIERMPLEAIRQHLEAQLQKQFLADL